MKKESAVIMDRQWQHRQIVKTDLEEISSLLREIGGFDLEFFHKNNKDNPDLIVKKLSNTLKITRESLQAWRDYLRVVFGETWAVAIKERKKEQKVFNESLALYARENIFPKKHERPKLKLI